MVACSRLNIIFKLRVLNLLLGGSWVVISGDIRKVTIIIAHSRGLITPLITTHEPPSRVDLQALPSLKPQPTPKRI